MKLLIAFVMLSGCASTPVMQPPTYVEPPLPEMEVEVPSPCWDMVKSALDAAVLRAEIEYDKADKAGYIDAAKKAGSKLYDKAADTYDAAMNKTNEE